EWCGPRRDGGAGREPAGLGPLRRHARSGPRRRRRVRRRTAARARDPVGAGRAAARVAPPRRCARPRAELLPATRATVPRRRDDQRPRVRGVPRGLRAADAVEVPDV
ncbi:MAG: hypothetical protein AVDCRST_MAG85-2485, partial [uncultured Solirubrobacteraceae bacterium]